MRADQRKEDSRMTDILMLLAALVPFTGDFFPAKILVTVIAIAAVVAIVLAVTGRKKNADDEDEDE